MYTTRPRWATLASPLVLPCMLVVALVGLSACGRALANVPASAPAPTSIPPSFLPTPPAFPSGPTARVFVTTDLVRYYNHPLDLCVGDVVVLGVVAQYGAPHWNSPDGTRANGNEVVTPMAFSQWQVLSDRRVGPTREYAARGGHAGNVYYYAEPGPKPPVGQRYILVFQASPLPGAGSGAQEADRLMELFAALTVNQQNEVYFAYSKVWVPLPALAGELAHCLGNHATTPTS